MAPLPPEVSARAARSQAAGLDLNVELRRGSKGVGLFAAKPIPRHSVIAYYLTKVYSQASHRNSAYAIFISGQPSVVGDLSTKSLPPPVLVRGRWVTYWAYFSNEPGADERTNCSIDDAMTGPFSRKGQARRVAVGDFYRFKLVSTRDIAAGEEIVWCYGSRYDRHHESSCDPKAKKQRSVSAGSSRSHVAT